MNRHGHMEVNRKGHLTIGGCDTVKLAKKYGTPLYVFDEQAIRDACRAYRKTFESRYHDVVVAYAGKAFMTQAMAALIADEGLSLDVCSGGELYTALSAGFPAERIYLHGNNKTASEIAYALSNGVGRLVVDNTCELELLNRLAGERGIVAEILLRVAPGVEAHTHEYIKTGQIDSKFGVGIPNGEAMKAIKIAMGLPNVKLMGIHCHVGSQIFDLECFEVTVDIMLGFARQAFDEAGFELLELDLGGGLGIKYNPKDKPTTIEALGEVVTTSVKRTAARYGIRLPRLVLEPGRSIVAEAGTTLYTVGGIKHIPGIRTYVSVDGGMADNPRVALYQAEYDAIIANKAGQDKQEIVSIAGNCCESGDMLIWNISLPQVEVGDVLAVFCTGAYNYSMASNYNRHGRPPVVFARDGRADVVVRRETYEDLIRKDVIPARLAVRERSREPVARASEGGTGA